MNDILEHQSNSINGNEVIMETSNRADKVVFYEVGKNRWPDFEKLFENRGGPKNCWCMVWRGNPEEHIWSLVCFYVSRKYRGNGVMKQLIQAAIDHSRQRGATVVEAYPVDPSSPSYRFMGFVPQFRVGFVEVDIAGSRRHVMRLDVK